MKVSLEWLKDFVDINCSIDELQKLLVGAGFEIEEVISLADATQKVVAGKIVEIKAHPNADKLLICAVDVGDKCVQIVTGADNVYEGATVPVALDGAKLPCGMNIKKGKLRGELSEGMLCSGNELNLTDDDYPNASFNGIMILDGNIPSGTDINEIVGTNDIVLDVGVTANRPDCNSILGIAREISAVLGKKLRMPSLTYTANGGMVNDSVKVEIRDGALCPRYMAGAVSDIKLGPSPTYMRRRLKALGIRPINNVVDITNYVLLEIGQPMHAFDARYLEGGKIIVRRAENGEKIVTLDDKDCVLDNEMLVIADAVKPSGVAGIMGGAGSGIKSDTTSVVLESACFKKENIRRTSRVLGLKSDSQFRYERGIDTESQEIGLKRALALIYELNAGIIAQGIIDIADKSAVNRTVYGSVNRINAILGITVTAEVMSDILNRLTIITRTEGDKLICEVPPFRSDIENDNDLAEEIIRIYGYGKIKGTLLTDGMQTMGGLPPTEIRKRQAKNILTGLGYSEILTYSFISPKCCDYIRLDAADKRREAIVLFNPLSEETSVMRTVLVPSMISALASNMAKSNKSASFFEFAKVYLPEKLPPVDLPRENMRLCLGSYGAGDFYSLKNAVNNVLLSYGVSAEYTVTTEPFLHGGIGADIISKGEKIGFIGEIHPEVAANYGTVHKTYIAEVDADMLNILFDGSYTFAPISKFPSVIRDLAVIVRDELDAAEILSTVKSAGGKLLVSSAIFDVYKGKGIESGCKSVAFSMEFTSYEKTLTEEEVNAKVDKITRELARRLGARLR